MYKGGQSKGFGNVRFNSPEEATKKEKVNGLILVPKPLYVSLALSRLERKAHLNLQYMTRVSGLRIQVLYLSLIFAHGRQFCVLKIGLSCLSSICPASNG